MVLIKAFRLCTVVSLLCSLIVLSGCTKQERTLSGILIGAGTGALIGSAVGNTAGGVAGAAIGGTVGGIIGHESGGEEVVYDR
jgi:hypothetical protein